MTQFCHHLPHVLCLVRLRLRLDCFAERAENQGAGSRHRLWPVLQCPLRHLEFQFETKWQFGSSCILWLLLQLALRHLGLQLGGMMIMKAMPRKRKILHLRTEGQMAISNANYIPPACLRVCPHACTPATQPPHHPRGMQLCFFLPSTDNSSQFPLSCFLPRGGNCEEQKKGKLRGAVSTK